MTTNISSTLYKPNQSQVNLTLCNNDNSIIFQSKYIVIQYAYINIIQLKYYSIDLYNRLTQLYTDNKLCDSTSDTDTVKLVVKYIKLHNDKIDDIQYQHPELYSNTFEYEYSIFYKLLQQSNNSTIYGPLLIHYNNNISQYPIIAYTLPSVHNVVLKDVTDKSLCKLYNRVSDNRVMTSPMTLTRSLQYFGMYNNTYIINIIAS